MLSAQNGQGCMKNTCVGESGKCSVCRQPVSWLLPRGVSTPAPHIDCCCLRAQVRNGDLPRGGPGGKKQKKG